MRRLLIALLFLSVAANLTADEVLDNAAVVKMVRAGLSPEIIMLKIERSEAVFDTSTDALVAMKTAGIPDPVIKAMLLKPAPTPASRTPRVIADPPKPLPPPQAATAEPERLCLSLSFYTSGNNGTGWYPAGVCATTDSLSIDEQTIPLSGVVVHCLSKQSSIGFGGSLFRGEQEWWFSDGKEVFKFKGKAEDLQRVSDFVTHARAAIPHGGCGDRDIRNRLAK